MTLAAEITAFLSQLDRAWLPVVDGLLKATLVLGLAGLVSLTLARASAAVRHLVWTLALSSALLLPVLSVALPRWQLPLVTLTSPAPAPAAVVEAPGTAPALSRRTADSAAPRTGARAFSPGADRRGGARRSRAARRDPRCRWSCSQSGPLVSSWLSDVWRSGSPRSRGCRGGRCASSTRRGWRWRSSSRPGSGSRAG